MAWAVAACLAGDDGATTIGGAECVAVSYPRFFEDLAGLTGGVG
jgi:5-enolpyruvylshikimate-3-phosphate synthase